MKKFKAIYLVIILGVLWIGAGVGAYFLLLSPEMTKRQGAEKKYNDAQTAMNDSYQKAMQSQATYQTSSQRLIENYQKFHAIQATMPKIYNMKEMYASREREGLRALYLMMGKGNLIGELKRWTIRYGGIKLPQYRFDKTLGYEDTLTGVNVVAVDFGEQTMVAYGYADLVKRIRSRYGYGHCPLIISGISGAATGGGAPGAAAPGGTPGAPTGTLALPQGPMGMPGAPGMPQGAPTGAPGMPQGEPTGAPGMPPGAAGMAGSPTMPTPPTQSTQHMQTMAAPSAPPSAPGMPSGASAPAGMPGGAPGATGMPGASGAPSAAGMGGAAAASIGSFTITVDRTNARHTPGRPALVMKYNAKGAFITRGWDPNQDVLSLLANARIYLQSPPALVKPQEDDPKPLIFGFLQK